MASTKNHPAPEERIAELEKAVASLSRENENYRTLFDSLLVGVQEIDTSGTIIYANNAHHKMYGYEDGELIGKSILEFSLSEAARQELAAYLDYLTREQPTPTPWVGRDQKKDGALIDVKVDWNYKRDREGRIIGFISLLSDITEKKKLQKELLESRTKFHSIFKHSPAAIIYADAQGIITTFNDNAAKLFRAPGEKLLGIPVADIRDEKMKDAITSALAGNKSQFKGEYRTEDGNILIYIKADFSPAFQTDGTVKGAIGIIEDITERKKAQEELARRKAEFEAMFNSITDSVLFADQQRRIVMINNGFTNLFGYTREEVVGKTTEFMYVNPEDYLIQGQKRFHAGAKVDSPVFEVNFRRKDNTEFPCEVTSSEVKDETGTTIGFVGFARDVTARKKAEQELRISEEKYSKLFNSEIDAIIVVDAKTQKIIDANEAFLKLYGYTRKESTQLKVPDISAEPEQTASTIQKTARAGHMRIRKRHHRKKDGTEIIVDIAAATFMLQDRTIIFARIKDITELVNSGKKLIELEKRYRIAFTTSPDAININKMDGTYVDINEGFTKLTGYTREDAIGKSSIDMNIWADPEDRRTLMQGLLRSRHVENLEADFRMKDGSIKTALMSANILLLNGEPHILSITRDITARKKAEEEKTRLETQLRQIYKMEAIGTMAGGIAHDFNNILTIILGNADLARFVLQDNKPAKQYIEKIVEASGRAKEMVRQILAFSRQAKQDLIPVKPHMVFGETLKLLRSTIPSSVDIQQDLDRQCPTIKADPTQLHQVLMNLCTNAAHSMDDKGTLTISLREVKLNSSDARRRGNIQPGSYAMLTVTDSGKGMSPEVVERIFDPFFTTKKVGEGTGMGLSVVHGIVQNHGGAISVESRPGQGTTFMVYFPAIKEAPAVIKDIDAPKHLGDERILFVDDEEDLASLVAEMLRLHGYQVTSMTSGIAALETFTAAPHDFDMVITDQTMPKISGMDLAEALLKVRPDLPIILCTGYSAKISHEAAAKIGIAEYFLKPFNAKELLRSIRKVLDSRK